MSKEVQQLPGEAERYFLVSTGEAGAGSSFLLPLSLQCQVQLLAVMV